MTINGTDGRGSAPQRRHKVLVVDELELVQVGLRHALTHEVWVEMCLTSGSPQQALRLMQKHAPHVVLLNTQINGISGLELSREMRRSHPWTKIVLMSSQGRVSPGLVRTYGATAFVSQLQPVAVLLSAVQAVVQGTDHPVESVPVDSQLSTRELDVLRCITTGMSNAETAKVLNVSRHTVKQHASAVYRKLRVRNRAEAAARAQLLGVGQFPGDTIAPSAAPCPRAVV